jgi:hypothetical protein
VLKRKNNNWADSGRILEMGKKGNDFEYYTFAGLETMEE